MIQSKILGVFLLLSMTLPGTISLADDKPTLDLSEAVALFMAPQGKVAKSSQEASDAVQPKNVCEPQEKPQQPKKEREQTSSAQAVG